ncbi:MAG: monovalent cation/H(+) antiporter subunit G [Alphaproteobacteria bacterium]|jgi:multicomponent Na+:H+ antiporter subunit G|nr:monovalent cation/H(+) antiporter subunit G [Alphaproteobacteria bacterium]
MNLISIFTFAQETLFSIFLLLGLIFCFLGVLGLFRFKDIYSKQHALGLIDTIGIFFICIALAINSGIALVSFKPIILSLLITFISAPSCYALMQIFIHRKQDKTLEEIEEKR